MGSAQCERACGGVRGGDAAGQDDASERSVEPDERSAPTQRCAREAVGESEGRPCWSGRCERAQRVEPDERSAPTERRAREAVGESEGHGPSDENAAARERGCGGVRGGDLAGQDDASERSESSQTNGARRRSGARERLSGSPRGTAPRMKMQRRAREAVGESEGATLLVRTMRASAASRARRTERADGAARERGCGGVRGGDLAGQDDASERSESSQTNGARRRSGARERLSGSPRGNAPRMKTERRAREAVGESEGQRPSDENGAARERGCRGVRGATPLG